MEHLGATLGAPDVDADLLCDLARVAHGAGELFIAQQLLERAVNEKPESAMGWWLLAYVHAGRKQWGMALGTMRKAHALDPDNADLLEKLVDLELDHGAPRQSLAALQRWAELRPLQVDAQLKLGVILGRLSRHALAAEHYQRAISRIPDAPDLWMALGQSFEYLGRSDESASAYNHARMLRPNWALPVAGLLGLSRRKADAGLWQDARNLLAGDALSDGDRAILGYELGKSLDSNAQSAEAMAMWEMANASRQRQIGAFDPQALESLVSATEAAFAQGVDWPKVSSSVPPSGVVLIVGMPRSGTTLVEQIINAHPLAHGAGELLDLTLMANGLDLEGSHWPEAGRLQLAEGRRAKLRDQYLQSLRARADEHARLFVDKAPLNFFFLGLAAQLFPDARVIWCRRNPCDVAVSIFGENFSLDAPFATSWEGIADYMVAETRLMELWRRTLPLPVLELDYQAMVNQPVSQSQRLIEFLGLRWDAACLEFHSSGAVVQTPSRWQVRQPVNRRSVGRWQVHADAMTAFIARARSLQLDGVQ